VDLILARGAVQTEPSSRAARAAILPEAALSVSMIARRSAS
jgi:hypothetical protein